MKKFLFAISILVATGFILKSKTVKPISSIVHCAPDHRALALLMVKAAEDQLQGLIRSGLVPRKFWLEAQEQDEFSVVGVRSLKTNFEELFRFTVDEAFIKIRYMVIQEPSVHYVSDIQQVKSHLADYMLEYFAYNHSPSPMGAA